MKKTLAFALLASLLLGVQVFAEGTNNNLNFTQKSYEELIKDYNFEDNSYYISDEQIQEGKDLDKIDDTTGGFWTKVINSGHFSSDTATKRYIPVNKFVE